MIYATPSDFARLGLPAAATADVPTETLLGQLRGASRKAEGYLRQRYQLPLLWDILLPAAVSGASGAGPAVDTHGAGALDLLLDLTALAGAGAALTATLQHSDDGVSGWGAAGSFAALAAAGTAILSLAGLKRFVRVSWALAGTTPTATFAVAVAADDLRGAVCAIAAYDDISVRGFNPEGPDTNLRLRYQDALAWLKGVALGSIDPGLTDSTPALEEGGVVFVSEIRRGW